MKRIVSFIVVLAVAMCGMTQVMAQKSITKEAKKVEREIKKQERLAQDAVEGQEEFNAAVQAINNRKFVLEADRMTDRLWSRSRPTLRIPVLTD